MRSALGLLMIVATASGAGTPEADSTAPVLVGCVGDEVKPACKDELTGVYRVTAQDVALSDGRMARFCLARATTEKSLTFCGDTGQHASHRPA